MAIYRVRFQNCPIFTYSSNNWQLLRVTESQNHRMFWVELHRKYLSKCSSWSN